MRAMPGLEETFEACDPFTCRHEGIGLVGCPTCDPLTEHVAAAYRWLLKKRERELGAQEAELTRLRAALNVPEVHDFMAGVPKEAAHQRARWGVEHDAGKADADWFWLLGYLAGKALHATDPEKRLHHQVTAAAVLANWHAHTLGKTNMRPGIAPPAGEGAGS